MTATDGAQSFRGFRSPNYTQVPDELFDELLPTLSGAELKVLLYIIRRTFGFKREADAISLSQMLHGISRHDGRVLDRGVGISKPTLLTALRSLVERKIIETERRRSEEKGDEPTIYRLKFATDEDAEPDASPTVVKKLDLGVVKKSAPPVVKKSAPQETEEQETERQERDFPSNIRMRTRAELNVDNSGANVDKPSRIAPSRPASRAKTTQHKPPTTSVVPADTATSEHPPRVSGEIESVGAVLKRGRGRPPKQPYDEDRQQILAYIQDFAREMGDKAPLTASVSRAYNLYKASGRPIALFVDAMYQARARTKERSAHIKAALDPSQPFAPKAKMAYYFALLEDELGLREDEPHDADSRQSIRTSRTQIQNDIV